MPSLHSDPRDGKTHSRGLQWVVKSSWILLGLMPRHPWGSLLCWGGLAATALGMSKAADLSWQEAVRRV